MSKRFLLVSLVVALAGCETTPTGVPADLSRLSYPISVAVHPDGRYVYVANAGFDRKAVQGTISVFDVDTHRFLNEAAVTTELFAGELKLVERDGEIFAFTTSRDSNAIYQFRVDASAGNSSGHLTLVHTKDLFGVRPFADDPYAVEVDEGGVTVGHLTNGVVSRWGFGPDNGLEFGCSITLAGSAAQVAKHPAVDRWYVTDAIFNRISVLTLRVLNESEAANTLTNCVFELSKTITVQSVTTRGLAFSPDGTKLFVTSATDDSLRVYDTTVGYSGVPYDTLIRSIPLGREPGNVRLARCHGEECLPGEGLLYVSIYGADQVVVIDPDTLTVVGRVDVGDTPYDIGFARSADGKLKLIVTNFDDASISIVDAGSNSASPLRHSAVVQ